MTLHGTDLYRSVIAYDLGDEERNALTRKVWDGTPWMADVFTGRDRIPIRDAEIRQWCIERFGPEASPIHDQSGAWHRGGATINGWTWMGFDTEAKLTEFLAAWPAPEGVDR